MMYVFAIHFKLRKGLGPQWIAKMEEIALDDLPDDMQEWEARNMAIAQFRENRSRNGTSEREYIITDINSI